MSLLHLTYSEPSNPRLNPVVSSNWIPLNMEFLRAKTSIRFVLYPLLLLGFTSGFFVLLAMGKLGSVTGFFGYYVVAEPFADTRVIEGAIRSSDAGLNPYFNNAFDILQRNYNYPQILLGLRFLSWGEGWIIAFGTGIVMAYALGCWSLSRLIDHLSGKLIFAILSFSPACFLGLERGNIDMGVFSIIVLGVFLISSNVASRRYVGYLLLFFTGILKIYPVFAFATAFSENRTKFFKILAVVVVGFGFYLLSSIESFRWVAQMTPAAPVQSFGFQTLPTLIDIRYLKQSQPELKLTITMISFVVCIALMILAYWRVRRKSVLHGQHRAYTTDGLLFLAGSALYIGCFLIGKNFDYRLVVLLMCLPFLLNNLRPGEFRFHRILVMTCVFFSMFVHFGNAGMVGMWVNEAANWILFGVLSYLFVYMLANHGAIFCVRKDACLSD